jgi:signal transduction histidine kinase
VNLFRLFERPDRYSVRWWAFDVLTAICTFAITLSARDRPSSPWLALLLIAPLVVRRVWPVPVFGLIVGLSVVISTWDLGAALNVSLVVAAYSVAAFESQRRALIAAAVLEVVLVYLLLRVPDIGWWIPSIVASGMVAAALGLGLYSSTRRAYLEELQDRAERLEHERDQQQELAAAAERGRITREMHDIVAHHLTVIVALSTGAAKIAVSSPEQAGEVMQTVSDTGRQALGETRRLLSGLGRDADQPGERGERHPVPDLAGLTELFTTVRAAGLPVDFEVSGTPGSVGSSAQLTVYRLVQEALTNTLKHGGPGARAQVRLSYRPGELQIVIEDDGSGMARVPALGAAPGRGLAGMNERVHAFGGEVESGPRSPRGWRVSARLTLDLNS